MALTPEEQRELEELEYEQLMAESQNASSTPPPTTSTQGQEPGLMDRLGTSAASSLQSYGNVMTLGYLPEMQAGYATGVEKLSEALGGAPATPYDENLKQFRGRADRLYEEAPVAGFVGGAGAVVNQIPMMAGQGVARGAGYLKRLADASKTGAIYGAASNPMTDGGLEENLKARGQNALIGAAAGGTLESGVTGVKEAFPTFARLSAGIPKEATRYYTKFTDKVDDMMAKPYGYKEKVEQIHSKINEAKAAQEVEAIGEFSQIAAQKRPTTIGPEGVEGRVNNLQSKIDETRSVTEKTLMDQQAAHQAELDAIAEGLRAQREAAVQKHVSSERARLNDTVKQQLGSDDIDNALVQRLNQRSEELKAAFYNKKREVGAAIQDGVFKSGERINIRGVFEPIEAEIDRLAASELATTPAVKAEIDGLVALHKSISEGLGDTLDAESAFLLKDRLKLLSKAQNMTGGYGGRASPNDSAIQKSIQDAGLKSYRNLNTELDRVANSVGARKEYKKMIDLEDVLDNDFSTPEKIMKSVEGLTGPKKVFMRDKVNKVKELTDGKIDLSDDYKIIENYNDLSLPDEKLVPRQLTKGIDDFYEKQRTDLLGAAKKQYEETQKPIVAVKKVLDRNFATPERTQKTLELAAKPGAHSSKKAVDEVSSIVGQDVNAEAMDIFNYKQLGKDLENFTKNPTPVGPKTQQFVNTKNVVDKKFSTPEQTFKTLSGYDKTQQKFLKHNVDEVGKATGQDLSDASRELQAYSWFEDPGLLPTSGGGTTSTSRSMGLSSAFEAVGGLFGETGRSVGKAVGNVAGGPLAIKTMIKGGKAASKIAPSPQNSAPLYTPWIRMNSEERNKKGGY